MIDELRAKPGLLLRLVAVAAVLAPWWTAFNQPGRTLLRPGDRAGDVGTFLVLLLGLVVARGLRGHRLRALAVAIALPVAALRVVGAHYHPRDLEPFSRFGPWALVELVVAWAVASIMVAAALRLLLVTRSAPSRPLQLWWCVPVSLVLLLCWLPYFLVYYPGILIRDSWVSLHMALGLEPLSNHHPVLFTQWVGQCLRMAGSTPEDLTAGIATFSIIQAIVLAGGLGFVVWWVHTRWGRGAALAALAYFGLDPTVGMWAITMQKDTLFALWLTLTTVFLAEVGLRGMGWLTGRRQCVALGALLLALGFSRNNGPLVAMGITGVLMVLVLIRAWRDREHWRAWCRGPLAGLLAVAIVLLVQGPGYGAAGVVPTSYTEKVGLPLNQVGWAVVNGDITPEQGEVVSNLLPLEDIQKRFNITIVDALKFSAGFDDDWLNEHPDEFMALWLDLAGENLAGYGQAWFALSGGYLDVDKVMIRLDPGTKRGAGDLVVHDRSLLGSEDLPKELPPDLARVITAPGFNLAYSNGLVFWACAVAVAAGLVRRRPGPVLALAPYLLTIGTLLVASPLCDFRYVGSGHMALPVLLCLLWGGPRTLQPDEVGPDELD